MLFPKLPRSQALKFLTTYLQDVQLFHFHPTAQLFRTISSLTLSCSRWRESFRVFALPRSAAANGIFVMMGNRFNQRLQKHFGQGHTEDLPNFLPPLTPFRMNTHGCVSQ